MNRKLLALTVLVLSTWGGTSTASAQMSRSALALCPGHVAGVKFYRSVTWNRQDQLGTTRTRSDFYPRRIQSCRYTVWVAHLWVKRAKSSKRALEEMLKAQRAQGALTNDWACIHRYEGAWNANTGNGYFGGLQMDLAFQGLYGAEFLKRWGTADRWPIWAQVTAANRAKRSGRGYGPWPNTARACGLL